VAFICLLELQLHLPENSDLKGKRRELTSLRAQLARRFGAAVAEVDHHDRWQRASLAVALVGRDAGPLSDAADHLQRYVDARFGDWTRWERSMLATEDLKDD
jgi:uncharacterized protein YlxP (DUF503 family)